MRSLMVLFGAQVGRSGKGFGVGELRGAGMKMMVGAGVRGGVGSGGGRWSGSVVQASLKMGGSFGHLK